MQTQHRNGSERPEIRDEADVQQSVLESSRGNPLLETTNLGLGNYDDSYLWQQIQSYRKGLYAYLAFEETISAKAVHETKVKLAREGFSYYDERRDTVEQWDPIDEDDVDELQSTWTAEIERGEQIWQSLNNSNEVLSEKQIVAIMKKAGVDLDWMPINWQMVAGRHEVSRSRNAELLRAVLTHINDLRGDTDGEVADNMFGGN